MIPNWLLCLAAALAITAALSGMALYAAVLAAFPGRRTIRTSDRIHLYAGSIAVLGLMGTIWTRVAESF